MLSSSISLGSLAGSPVSFSPFAAATTSLTPPIWWIAAGGAILALVMAFVFYQGVMKADAGNEKMQEIAGYVREGAMAYLARQYRVVAIVFVVLLVILAVCAFAHIQNPFVPIAFLTGGFFSGLCGYL
ncbi:MAG: hypothetical protein D6820_03970, partial [Lentisphaerae bacterium]